MCLIVFAWKVNPHIPLIAAANRDEFYERASAPAGAWPEHPQVYAGRDLQAGGSWMGITQAGSGSSRFAAITNIRSPQDRNPDAPSRGALVADYPGRQHVAARLHRANPPRQRRLQRFQSGAGRRATP